MEILFKAVQTLDNIQILSFFFYLSIFPSTSIARNSGSHNLLLERSFQLLCTAGCPLVHCSTRCFEYVWIRTSIVKFFILWTHCFTSRWFVRWFGLLWLLKKILGEKKAVIFLFFNVSFNICFDFLRYTPKLNVVDIEIII